MKINIRGLRALSSPGCGDRNAREEGRQGKGCNHCVSSAQSHSTPQIRCSVPKLCGGELGVPRGPAGGQLFQSDPAPLRRFSHVPHWRPGSSAPAGGLQGKHRIPPALSAPESWEKLGGNGHEMAIADFCLQLGPVEKLHGGAMGAQCPGGK